MAAEGQGIVLLQLGETLLAYVNHLRLQILHLLQQFVLLRITRGTVRCAECITMLARGRAGTVSANACRYEQLRI